MLQVVAAQVSPGTYTKTMYREERKPFWEAGGGCSLLLFLRVRNFFTVPHSLAFVVAQENAKDLYKHMTPLLQKCMLIKRTTTGMMSPSSSMQQNHRRAGQQADNLVWQQEAFHKVLKLQALLKEGLISEAELQTCRKDILAVVAAVHQDGEWANFTRDKLLFLQVCFCCSCLRRNSAMTVKMTERLGSRI